LNILRGQIALLDSDWGSRNGVSAFRAVLVGVVSNVDSLEKLGWERRKKVVNFNSDRLLESC
jgi:hypothetical protein